MIRDLLIIGDLAGRERAGRSSADALARRRLWSVDRDDLDDVMARIAPQVRVAIDPQGPPTVIEFRALDDFHPDQLAQRVPLLRQLRELRGHLAAPGRVSPPPAQSPSSAVAARDDAAAALSGGSLLDRILDDTPGAPTTPSAPAPRSAPVDDLSEFVRRAVTPHLVSDPNTEQRGQIAMIDDAIAAALRAILHDPAFQSLESLWRGIDLVTRRVDTSESLHIALADVTRSELAAALADDSDMAAGGVRALLETPSAGGDGPRWAFVVLAHSYGADDLTLLGRLARVARDAGVPCISAANPELAGASFGDGSDSDDWSTPTVAGWDELRRDPAARWLSLALPRFLVRLPYGVNGEACEVVPFEEVGAGSFAHESLLWANSAFLCATVLAQSVTVDGTWATQGIIGNLPFYVRRVDGEAVAVPCAESALSQRSVIHLVERGLTAVSSARDGDMVRVPRLQSIASPAAPLALTPNG